MDRNGYFKGIKLCGKVKVVSSFPDIKVKVVDSFPDLKVNQSRSTTLPIHSYTWNDVKRLSPYPVSSCTV